jgi:hypothetical protein
MRMLASVLVALTLSAVNCGGGSSQDNGHWYGVGYTACFHIVKQRPLPMKKIERIDHLIFRSSGDKRKALENGCRAGSAKGGGKFSNIAGTSNILSP